MKFVVCLLVAGLIMDVESKCDCNCTVVWKPVCAKDRKTGDVDTFPNNCVLQCYNCTHEKNYLVQSQQECQDSRKKSGK